MKKLSVITICFNDHDGLEKTMRSVFSQLEADFEYIIVDGGSTDGSVELIKSNKEKITRWVSEKDSGIYNAQNKGLQLAQGEYCLFLNSGDYFANADVLKEALLKMKPGVDIAYGDAKLEDDRGIYRTKIHPGTITSYWLIKEVVAHQSQFIRRDLLLENGGYDESYKIVSDYAFFARLYWSGGLKLQYLEMIVSVFNTQGLSSDHLQKDKIFTERKKVHREYAPRFLFWLYYTYGKLNRLIGR